MQIKLYSIDIQFETPCGSILEADLKVENDGEKVTILNALVISVGRY